MQRDSLFKSKYITADTGLVVSLLAKQRRLFVKTVIIVIIHDYSY
jgi:hypothetical protein